MLTIDIKKAMMTSEGVKNLRISTVIHPHEFIALFGHSGSGKTTLISILAGFIKPDEGFISFNNTTWFDSVRKINLPTQKRNIGFMFQDYALFPNLTVGENILFASRSKHSKELEKHLAVFALNSLQHRKPHQLSGGQKQRVALARALASKPDLLLLDEPLSALDDAIRNDLQHEIQKSHQLLDAITIMVSHNREEVLSMATTVINLRQGAIYKQSPCQTFISETGSESQTRYLNDLASLGDMLMA